MSRAQTDPGVCIGRLDDVWRHHAPRFHPLVTNYLRREHTERPVPLLPLTQPSIETAPETRRERRARERSERNRFLKIIMAPVDLVEWVIEQWWNPSDSCMRCIRVTYWLVLIIGGIVSIVVALAPFV
jgi:hypothetical protein